MDQDSETHVFSYSGAIYVRPCGRGICLTELPDNTQLEDAIPEGDFLVEIVVRRKTPNTELTGAPR